MVKQYKTIFLPDGKRCPRDLNDRKKYKGCPIPSQPRPINPQNRRPPNIPKPRIPNLPITPVKPHIDPIPITPIPPPPSPAHHGGDDTGKIVGGVLGGLAGVGLTAYGAKKAYDRYKRYRDYRPVRDYDDDDALDRIVRRGRQLREEARAEEEAQHVIELGETRAVRSVYRDTTPILEDVGQDSGRLRQIASASGRGGRAARRVVFNVAHADPVRVGKYKKPPRVNRGFVSQGHAETELAEEEKLEKVNKFVSGLGDDLGKGASGFRRGLQDAGARSIAAGKRLVRGAAEISDAAEEATRLRLRRIREKNELERLKKLRELERLEHEGGTELGNIRYGNIEEDLSHTEELEDVSDFHDVELGETGLSDESKLLRSSIPSFEFDRGESSSVGIADTIGQRLSNVSRKITSTAQRLGKSTQVVKELHLTHSIAPEDEPLLSAKPVDDADDVSKAKDVKDAGKVVDDTGKVVDDTGKVVDNTGKVVSDSGKTEKIIGDGSKIEPKIAEWTGITTSQDLKDAAGGEEVVGQVVGKGVGDASEATEVATKVGERVGVKVAEEAAGEATGDLAAAGLAETLGGGPEDPIGDIIAVGFLAASLATAFHKHTPDVDQLDDNDIQDSIKKLQSQAAVYKATGQKTKATTANNLIANLTTAKNEGRAVYSVESIKGGQPRQLIVQLPNASLNASVAKLQINPLEYVGIDPNVLQAAGLNPALSTKAGALELRQKQISAIQTEAARNKAGLPATAETNEATWAPFLSKKVALTTGVSMIQAAGGYGNVLKSQIVASTIAYNEDIKKAEDLKAGGDAFGSVLQDIAAQKQHNLILSSQYKLTEEQGVSDKGVGTALMNITKQATLLSKANYVNTQNAIIAKIKDPQQQAAEQYQLNLWAYNNKLSSTKPVVPAGYNPATQKQITQAEQTILTSSQAKTMAQQKSIASSTAPTAPPSPKITKSMMTAPTAHPAVKVSA